MTNCWSVHVFLCTCLSDQKHQKTLEADTRDFVYDLTLSSLCMLSSDISLQAFRAFCTSWHWNRQPPAVSPTPTPRKHCSLNRCVGADMWSCYQAAPYLLPDLPTALLLKQFLTSTKMNILSKRYCNTAIYDNKDYIRACTFPSLVKSLHKLMLSTPENV